MKWKRGGSSDDIIDARGGGGGGGRMRLPGGRGGQVGGGLGVAGIIIFLAIQLLGGGGGSGGGFPIDSAFDGGSEAPQAAPIDPAQDPERDLRDFSAYVFTRAQDTWEDIFARSGDRYERAKLVLFREGVRTGCGPAGSEVGPFYCPPDKRAYVDLSFYRDMESKLGASGDFAWAYVIAHELGHHVQQELGTEAEVNRLRRERPDEANALSVRLELQADCYAGVWAQSVYESGDLEAGDVEEAFAAAEAVGDDRLQRRSGGGVNPDTFTHGTSEQRRSWFDRGRQSGEPSDCDTFGTDEV